MLKKAGLDFSKHQSQGIDHVEFAKILKTSGLISNKDLTWIAFNSSFDFAYLVKLLEQQPLPLCKNHFLTKLNHYFPTFFDVKHLANTTGNLAQQAIKSDIKFEGNHHQAGSDSLVTMKLFCGSKDACEC